MQRSDRIAEPSLCAGTATSSPYPWPTEYPWPIAPFHEQHPIRGYFGDPRTVFRDDTDPELGAFAFHNGVDIVAPEGTPVYPVVTGEVTQVRVNEVVVASEAGGGSSSTGTSRRSSSSASTSTRSGACSASSRPRPGTST